MKPIFLKFKHVFLYNLVRILSKYKWYIIVFFIILLIGYITGVLTASKYASDLTCDNLINVYLYSLLKKEIKPITYFIILSIFYGLIVLFFVFFTRNKFMVLLDAFLLFLIAYISGFDICVICVCLGLSGILLGVLTYGVLGLVVFFNLCTIMAIACSVSGCQRNGELNMRGLWQVYGVMFLVSILCLFLISFIFSFIHLFVIVE